MSRTLVVFVDGAAAAIAKSRAAAGLPEIPIAELSYGLDEVMQIVNVLDAELVTGHQATLHGLLTILERGWDTLWLITHGEEDGWYLNDGIVNASETTAFVRSSGVELTVMNTCSSSQVARIIAEELGTAFVCTVSAVPDRAAFITGVIFAQKLAAGVDYELAYSLAKPGQNSTYELIRAKRHMAPVEKNNENGAGWGDTPDATTLRRFMQSVNDLDLIVNGSPRLGLPALKDTTRDLRRDLDELLEWVKRIESGISNIERRQDLRNALFVVLTSVIVILLAVVAVLIYRGLY